MFQVLWEQEKKKNAFTWENKNRRHDAFAVHDFGNNVDRVVAPTTREQGTKQAINLQVMSLENNEERKNKPGGDGRTRTPPNQSNNSENARKRAEAIAELD